MKKWSIAIVAFSATLLAHAQAPNWRLYTQASYSMGGDVLAKGGYTSGATFNLNAGSGVALSLGADYRLSDQLTIQASFGHHGDREVGTNGSVGFERQPVELTGFYAVNEQVRVGLGVRKARNARVQATRVAVGIPGSGSYDSSVGVILEGQYFFEAPSKTERKPVVGINLRLVQESYTLGPDGIGSRDKKDGSHIGLGVVLYY